MNVRPYQPADLPALMHLFQDTVRRVNARDYAPEQIAAWAPESLDREPWAKRLAESIAWTACEGDTVVGFATFDREGHIDLFYTHADYQGRGIGTALLLKIEAQARELALDRLDSEVSITARPFFERRGFKVLAEQQVECRGQRFTNFRMEKHLAAIQPRGILETVVYVSDLAAAERFYTDVLGLVVVTRSEGRHVFFRSGQGMFLVFNAAVTATETTHVAGVAIPRHGALGASHMAFTVWEADLPAWRTRLTAAGVDIEAEVPWPGGGHSLYFRDPAGNSIELATPALWGLSELLSP